MKVTVVYRTCFASAGRRCRAALLMVVALIGASCTADSQAMTPPTSTEPADTLGVTGSDPATEDDGDSVWATNDPASTLDASSTSTSTSTAPATDTSGAADTTSPSTTAPTSTETAAPVSTDPDTLAPATSEPDTVETATTGTEQQPASTETTAVATTTAAPSTTEATVAPSGPIRIMALGDSLTDGGDPGSPTNSPQSYRGYLSAGLLADGYDVDFVGSKNNPAIGGGDPDHEGHGGFTIGPDASTLCDTCGSSNLSDNLDSWLEASPADVILLMAGVNDMLPEPQKQAGGYWRPVSPADAAPKLTALVAKLRSEAPNATILVGSYPPISFLVDPNLDRRTDFLALNRAARTAGNGSDSQVIYVPVFETLDGAWTSIDVLANGDELHPSANGAARIAAIWAEALTPVLNR